MPALGLQYHMGVDGISLFFIVLSCLFNADLYSVRMGCDQNAREGVYDRSFWCLKPL